MGWERRLELSGYLIFILSIIATVGAAPSYNSAIGVLVIVAHHTRRGRHIFVSVISLILSFVMDVTNLASINFHDKTNYITIIILPLLMILKIVGTLSAYAIFASLGGTWSLAENTIPMDDHHSQSGNEHLRTPSMIEERDVDLGGNSGGGGRYRDSVGSGFYSPSPSQGLVNK